MSRSYKKVPITKDNYGGKTGKRFANKAVRRKKDELFKGKDYKKVYNSYDINDYISYYPKDEAIENWEEEEKIPGNYNWRHNKYKTLKEWLIQWKKWMIRK